MQNPDHLKSPCPKCDAGPGEPCTMRYGREALKVHYGRPGWSEAIAAREPLDHPVTFADLARASGPRTKQDQLSHARWKRMERRARRLGT
jgi:hypothetical protein